MFLLNVRWRKTEKDLGLRLTPHPPPPPRPAFFVVPIAVLRLWALVPRALKAALGCWKGTPNQCVRMYWDMT